MWLKYSNEPIDRSTLIDVMQQPSGTDNYKSAYDKPRGFWITDDSEDNWPTYVRANMSDHWKEQLACESEVRLDESKLLIIRDLSALDDFADEWGYAHRWVGPFGYRWGEWCIQWDQVAARYDGIIVTPYQWSRRLPMDVEMSRRFQWYYTWDCASGCVWRARAILEVKLIKRTERNHERSSD